MEEQDNDNDYVLVFDHFYTNNHIQIMKTLLPYIDSAAMSMLPVMIKYISVNIWHQRKRKASSKSSNSCILWITCVRCSK